MGEIAGPRDRRDLYMRKNLPVLIALVAPLALVIFLVVDLHERDQRDMIELFQDQQLWVARQLSRELRDFVMGHQRGLVALSSSLENLDAESVGRRLPAYLGQVKYLTALAVSDDEGKIVASTADQLVGQTLLEKEPLDWAKRPENQGQALLTPVVFRNGPRQGTPTHQFFFLTPLYRIQGPNPTRRFVGFVAYSADLDDLLLEQPILIGTKTSRLWIIDQAGRLLVHSEHPEMLMRNITQANGQCRHCHTSLDYAWTILREKQGAVDYKVNNFPKKLAAFAPFEAGDAKWIVVVNSPYDVVTAPAKTAMREMFLLLGVTILAFAGGSAFLYRNYTLKLKAEEEAKLLREKRSLEDKIQLLAAQLLTVQEDERRRLSRELHDDINQKLAMLAMDLELLAAKGSIPLDSLTEQLHTFRDRVAELSDCVHDLAYQLHPSVLDDLGLGVALKSYIKDYSQREGIDVTFHQGEMPEVLEPEVSTCLYRVVQESLRNVAKHAKAEKVWVTVESTPDTINLTVKDSGVGFTPESRIKGSGLGLVSMQERVRLVHGDFAVTSSPGGGTQISVRVPLEQVSSQVSSEPRQTA